MDYKATKAWIKAEAKMYHRDKVAERKRERAMVVSARAAYGPESYDKLSVKTRASEAIRHDRRSHQEII